MTHSTVTFVARNIYITKWRWPKSIPQLVLVNSNLKAVPPLPKKCNFCEDYKARHRGSRLFSTQAIKTIPTGVSGTQRTDNPFLSSAPIFHTACGASSTVGWQAISVSRRDPDKVGPSASLRTIGDKGTIPLINELIYRSYVEWVECEGGRRKLLRH